MSKKFVTGASFLFVVSCYTTAMHIIALAQLCFAAVIPLILRMLLGKVRLRQRQENNVLGASEKAVACLTIQDCNRFFNSTPFDTIGEEAQCLDIPTIQIAMKLRYYFCIVLSFFLRPSLNKSLTCDITLCFQGLSSAPAEEFTPHRKTSIKSSTPASGYADRTGSRLDQHSYIDISELLPGKLSSLVYS